MRKFTFILGIVLLLWSCGGPRYEPPDLSGYVWPQPPNPPRVKLVKVISTDADIRTKTTSEMLFGEAYFFAFKKPHGLAIDREGNIIVSDSFMRKVFILNLDKGSVGELINLYGWGALAGVATDNVNGLIALTSGSQVHIFDQAKRKLKLAIGGAGEFARPAGLAFDPERKRLYIADTKRHEIHAYDYDGNHLAQIAAFGNGEGQVYYPTSLATDSEGRLYVVDTMNWRVQVFNPDYTFLTAFGGHGDAPGTFARPKGIAVSQDGFIFVTDAAFGNFQIFDLQGKTYLFVGRPGSGFGEFNQPQDIYIDENDRIYVVDQTNRRIQVFQYLSDRYLEKHPEEATR